MRFDRSNCYDRGVRDASLVGYLDFVFQWADIGKVSLANQQLKGRAGRINEGRKARIRSSNILIGVQ